VWLYGTVDLLTKEELIVRYKEVEFETAKNFRWVFSERGESVSAGIGLETVGCGE